MSDPIDRLNAALTGRYRIERQLGEGGMATVYLATDLRHDRNVALKVLKPELAAVVGAERFLAEIRTTAALQHPHILPLHDSGEADGLLYYVMPFVDGESLRDRLDREKQLPVQDAVRIAGDLADALAYAHGQGVIHRDIKPANILLPSGRPVISDFGIALALSAGGAARMTETGMSLGTPHYMSPEQATGDQPVGPPSDIYALGCVLYEMLLGEPPYGGGTAQAILGKIITGTPDRPSARRPSIPAHVDAAIRRALEKVPADRFTTAQDFAGALHNPSFRHGNEEASGPLASTSVWKRAAVALGALSVASLVALAFALFAGPATPPQPSIRSAFNLPPGEQLADQTVFAPSIAISKDGMHVVYTATRDGVAQLFDRPIDSEEARPIPGTEGGSDPFFSPDGRWIGFAQGATLKKVLLAGGAPVTIGGAALLHGAAWSESDTVYYSLHESSIWKVSAGGGTPVPVTVRDSVGDVVDDVHPDVLPGGRAILFTRNTNVLETSWVAVKQLDTGEQRDLVNGWTPRYAASGHIVFTRGSQLWAVRFDADRLETVGEPYQLLDGMWTSDEGGHEFAMSDNGMLVYAPAPDVAASEVVRVDSTGTATEIFSATGVSMPRVSPDGSRLALWISNDLWSVDLTRLTRTRLTHGETGGATPFTWSPDGRYLAFFNVQDTSVIRVTADGSSGPEPFIPGKGFRFPTSWSADGRAVALYANEAETLRDLMTWRVGDAAPTPFLVTRFQERMPRFSPDGDWIAYVSDESGRDEVYLQAYPGPGGKMTVSVDGGTEPAWSADGRRLYYRIGAAMMVVEVTTRPQMAVGSPRRLFENDGYVVDLSPARGISEYDVLPDGRGFVMIRGGGNPTRIEVIQNWFRVLEEGASR